MRTPKLNSNSSPVFIFGGEAEQFRVVKENQDYLICERVKLDAAGQKVETVLDTEYTRIAKPFDVRCRPWDTTYRVAAGLTPEIIVPEAGATSLRRYTYAPNGPLLDAPQNPWNIRNVRIVDDTIDEDDEVQFTEIIDPPYIANSNFSTIIVAARVTQRPIFTTTERVITGPNPGDFRDDVFDVDWIDLTERTFQPIYRDIRICNSRAGRWFVKIRASLPFIKP